MARIYGTSGSDVRNGTQWNDYIYGYAKDSDRTLDDSDVLRGYAGQDRIRGGGGADTLFGGDGVDILWGHTGNDRLYGGEGESDQLWGGRGNDYLEDRVGGGSLFGQWGADTLVGSSDHDVLNGGFGRDSLTGGEGWDQFQLMSRASFGDTITDFQGGGRYVNGEYLDDQIVIGSGAVDHNELNASTLVENELGKATKSSQRFVFDTDDHKLYYDSDGSGSAAAILIVTIQNVNDVAPADFFVF